MSTRFNSPLRDGLGKKPGANPSSVRRSIGLFDSAARRRAHASLGVLRGAPSSVGAVLRSPGQPLDAGTRACFEPRFGHDFGKVRVHADSAANQSAQAVDAAAYTVANHIVFGRDAYDPGTSEGSRLLAHELAHVVQQSGSTSLRSGHTGLLIGSRDDPIEHEAARTVDRLAGRQALQEAVPALARDGKQNLRRQSIDDQRKKDPKPLIPLPHPLDRLDIKPIVPLPGGLAPPSTEDVNKAFHALPGQHGAEPAALGCLAGWNLRKSGTGAGMCCQGYVFDKDKCCPPARMRVTPVGATCAPAPISKDAPTRKPAPETK